MTIWIDIAALDDIPQRGARCVDTPAGKMVGRNPRDMREGDEAILFVRPERMQPANGAADHNVVESPVSHQEFEGAFVNVFLEPVQGRTVMVQTTNAGAGNSNGNGYSWQSGAAARITFRPEDAVVLPQSEDVS